MSAGGAPDALGPWFAEGLDEASAWTSVTPGPGAAELAARLSTVPQPFLTDPIDVLALCGDVFDEHALWRGTDPLITVAQRISAAGPASCTAAGLGLWLFASEELVGPFATELRRDLAGAALLALALRLAPIVAPQRWLADAERRKEAVRTFLLWGGMLPGGESPADARARYDLCDSVAQDQTLAQAMTEYQHRLDVTRALDEARAREAAARYTHE